MIRAHVQSIDTARAITAHALGIRIDGPEPKPATWTRWHNDQIEAREVQLRDAYKCVSSMHVQLRDLWYQRNHWRLAAVIGWSLTCLLIASGWGR